MRGLPEAIGELPVATLAEEIDTPGEGQVRALITMAGNPLVSTPNSDRLERAVEALDFMLSIDIYVNETTRHADVILPAPARSRSRTTTSRSTSWRCATWPTTRPPCCEPSVPAEWETLRG